MRKWLPPRDRGGGEARAVILALHGFNDYSNAFEGTGETAWGCKFVLVAARLEEEQARIILDVEAVEKPGREAAVAMECFARWHPWFRVPKE